MTAIIAEGVIRIFTNSSEYANEFNTVDYIKNLISKINSTKSPLTLSQDLTNILYKFSNEASPCVRPTDLSGNTIERLLNDNFDQISFKYIVYNGPFQWDQRID